MFYPVNYRGSDLSGKLIVIIGMQYGSEGKGAIASHISPVVGMGIRSGAANAGHTIFYKNRKFVMRQIPVNWINPKAKLVIAAGSLVSPEVLLNEIEEISKFSDIKDRLFIDGRAHIITQEHIQAEQKTDLASRIGSCSAISREGIGMAAAAKVLRESSCVQAKDFPEFKLYIADTVDLINTHLEDGGWAVLEGTQGFGLSIDHGHFPFVTSRDVSVGALVASVGLVSHGFCTEVVGVTRTYPIRVAGNSGPFGEGSQEITWEEVARRSKSSRKIIEKTSVTNKIRRVATFSKKEFLRACRVNRPTRIALTFADYLDASIYETKVISDPVRDFVAMIEDLSSVPVSFIKTGPRTVIDLEAAKVNKFYQRLSELATKK